MAFVTSALAQVSLQSAVFDLHNPGDVAEVNGAFLVPFSPLSSAGTGVFVSFLGVHADDSERGYNTGGKVEFDTKAGAHTTKLLLSDIPVTTINGTSYLEFHLDLNESDAPITLNAIHLLTSLSPNLTGYDPAEQEFSSPSATFAYDLGDNQVNLYYRDNKGSGRSDYLFLVPVDSFNYVADASVTYLYLYCEFGLPGLPSDGGFEEWATLRGGDPIFQPGVKIEKYVNGVDADSAPGPVLVVGEPVTWTYYVSLDGNYDLTDLVVSDDDDDLTVIYQSGDTNGDRILDAGETWVYEATGTAIEGDYSNIGTVNAKAAGLPVTDSDEAHYNGVPPTQGSAAILIEKFTNGQDADVPPGPIVGINSNITWTYEVSNVSNKPNIDLEDVTVEDDLLGSITPHFVGGDTNSDGKLNIGEIWIYKKTLSKSAILGQYSNIGTASATAKVGNKTVEVMDSDASHYYGIDPWLFFEKVTNGSDGPEIIVGNPVVWTYYVINGGNVPFTTISVTDSDPNVIPEYKYGDDGDGILDVGETWVYEAYGVAQGGEYSNTGYVTAIYTYYSQDALFQNNDESSYFGAVAGLSLKKTTNGEDADNAPGPIIKTGGNVIWRYEVSNDGDIPLSQVKLSDDQGLLPIFISGDDNEDQKLDPNEIWVFEAEGIAGSGQYKNIGTVTAETSNWTLLSASDASHYYGMNASIDIEKSTNGKDADSLPGPSIVAGEEVKWTYTVTNTGTVPLNTVKVKDDKEGTISGPISGDDDNNGLLDPGETWVYEKTGTAISGEYTNVGTVTAKVALPDFVQSVTDKDTSHYTGGTYDFGDAPKSYRTLLGQNGPRHIVDPKLRMGGKNDYDLDGMPSPDADGDDTNGTDDEDGIDDSQLTLIEGTIPKIEVQVRNTTGKNAWLTGWIDYDGDGAWDGQATAMVLPGATSVELSLPRVPSQEIDFTSCIEPNKKRLYVLDGATRLIKYKLSNGTAEVYAKDFIGAHGMAADEDGNIYVADYGAATLYVVPAGGGEKKPLTRWTHGGPPTPWALTYHNYYLYLCDRVMNRVLEIDPLTGDSAIFIGDVVDPVAIAFDADGYAYVATHNGGFLAKYDPSGNLVNPKFVNPNVGYVDISDVLINPLELPEPIETYARFRISTDKAAVQVPTGEAPDGEVEDYLVTLKPNSSILFFTGNDANTVYGCNAEGECVALADFYDNGLHNPFGLAMNCDGNLFISNSGGASITVLDTLTGESILWDDYTDGTLQEAAGPYKILILDK